MNPLLTQLKPYPFERLRALKASCTVPSMPLIDLSIGEPKHPTPKIILDALIAHTDKVSQYPLTKGDMALREVIEQWLKKRFHLNRLCVENEILPVNGTREAIFALAQAVVDGDRKALVISSNPFYQIYEGAGLLAGAQMAFINLLPEHNFEPDFSAISVEDWQRCQMVYICSPNNPTGSVMSDQAFCKLIELSQIYNFVIASDECYSEIYFDESMPPNGLLQVAAKMGLDDYRNCVVFHSLSKRSNAPGLRSGFVAGDARILKDFLLYRTYHGCAMPPHHQMASIAAWSDETHVVENRRLYRHKFIQVLGVLGDVATLPNAGFYLWLNCANWAKDDEAFTKAIYQSQHVNVVPGSYLSRSQGGVNPGANFVRMALVAPLDECLTAAHRIKAYVS